MINRKKRQYGYPVGTELLTPGGFREISSLRAGDAILMVAADGSVTETKVREAEDRTLAASRMLRLSNDQKRFECRVLPRTGIMVEWSDGQTHVVPAVDAFMDPASELVQHFEGSETGDGRTPEEAREEGRRIRAAVENGDIVVPADVLSLSGAAARMLIRGMCGKKPGEDVAGSIPHFGSEERKMMLIRLSLAAGRTCWADGRAVHIRGGEPFEASSSFGAAGAHPAEMVSTEDEGLLILRQGSSVFLGCC
jgi:hypothetical protein